MSTSIVTIEVPRDENETVFLLRVVQAALKAYRNTHNTSGQVNNSTHEMTDRATATLR